MPERRSIKLQGTALEKVRALIERRRAYDATLDKLDSLHQARLEAAERQFEADWKKGWGEVETELQLDLTGWRVDWNYLDEHDLIFIVTEGEEAPPRPPGIGVH